MYIDQEELIQIAECDSIAVKNGGKRSYKHVFQELFEKTESLDLTPEERFIKVTRMAIIHLVFYGGSLVENDTVSRLLSPVLPTQDKQELLKLIKKNIPSKK